MNRFQNPTVIKGLGITGLVLGIIALIVSFIPYIGMFAFFPGAMAVFSSGTALYQAGRTHLSKNLLAAALIIAIIGTSVGAVWGIIYMKSSGKPVEFKENQKIFPVD